jgi:hypothetical protein
MTVHNHRCDCCGCRIPIKPGRLHPGGKRGHGLYCGPCYLSLDRAYGGAGTRGGYDPEQCPEHAIPGLCPAAIPDPCRCPAGIRDWCGRWDASRSWTGRAPVRADSASTDSQR